MGQDNTKATSKGSAAESAQYEKEVAKMHHVTTRDNIVAAKTPHELEAERLQQLYSQLTYYPPLLRSSVEGALLSKRDKLVEEATQTSDVLCPHQLFTEDIIRLMAQYQTIELREGAAAAKRAEEIVTRFGQSVYYGNVLRSTASSAVTKLHHASEALSDVDRLLDDVESMHQTILDISHVAMEVNALLSDAERTALREEVEHVMNDDLVRSRSQSLTPASSRATPSTTPRAE